VLIDANQRNIKRFPADFMFRLISEEFKNLLFQNGSASWGGTRLAPNAFTEQGVAMLSGILSSDRAINVNIQIMRIFTRTRQMFMDNTNILNVVKFCNKAQGRHELPK
jgi:hypothetical protein